MARADWAQEMKFFAEAEPRVLGTTDPSLLGDRELKRHFKVVRESLRSSALLFLNKFTSADNLAAIDGDYFQYYVDNPKADGKVWPGRWRAVSNEEIKDPEDPEQQGIVQTLRYGFLQAISATNPSTWGMDARLVENREAYQPTDAVNNPYGSNERILRIQFRNCDPDSLESLAASFRIPTVVNPTARGVQIPGTFYVLAVKTVIEQDGSGTVEILLGDPEFQVISFERLGTPKASELRYLYGIPKMLVQTVIDQLEALGVEGSQVTASFSRETETFDLIYRVRADPEYYADSGELLSRDSCMYRKTVRQYYGLSYDTLILILSSLPYSSSGVIVETSTRCNEDDDYSWDLTVEITYRIVQSIPLHVSQISLGQVVQSASVLGTPYAHLYDISSYDEQGFIYRRSLTKNEDCTYDDRLDAIESIPNAIEFTSISTVLSGQVRTNYQNWRDPLSAPVPLPLSRFTVDQQRQEDGTYNASLSYDYAKSSEFSFRNMSVGRMVRDVFDYNLLAEPIAAADSFPGVVYETSNTLTELGGYQAKLSVTEFDPRVTHFASTRSRFRRSNSIEYLDYPAVIEAPETPQGMYQARSNLNEHDLYNGQLEYSFRDQEASVTFRVTENSGESVDRTLYIGSAEPLTIPERGLGSIYQATQSIDDEGFYSGNIDYRVSIPTTVRYLSRSSPIRRTMLAAYSNLREPWSVPEGVGLGGLYESSMELQPDDTYSGRVAYSFGVDTNYFFLQTSATNLGDGYAYIYDNVPTLPAIPDDMQGVTYASQFRLDELGYSGAVTVACSDEADYRIVASYGPDTYTMMTLARNTREAPDLDYDTTGEFNRSITGFAFNDDGTYNYAVVEDQIIPPTRDWNKVITWTIHAKVFWETLNSHLLSSDKESYVFEAQWVSTLRQCSLYETHQMKYFKSLDEAAAFVSGGAKGSTFSAVGSGTWMGHRISEHAIVHRTINFARPKFSVLDENGDDNVRRIPRAEGEGS